MKKVKGAKMEYCSKCKNVSICKYTSDITDIENKVNEIKGNSPLYTITFKCLYFEPKLSVNKITTTKLNESNPMKFFGTESDSLKNVIY